MIDYIGVRCPVCDKKFTGSDDIVVCPVCGAPHHRACYFESNHCVFESEHLSGKSWHPPYEQQEPPPPATKECPGCRRESPAENLFCNHCGRKLEGEAQGPPPGTIFSSMPWPELDQSYFIYGGLSENEVVGSDITARELASYVGPSSAYYLPRFKALERNSRTITINFSAMVFGFMFYFYRKMYLLGTVLLVLFLLGTIPNILAVREAFPHLVDQYQYREMLEAVGVNIGSVEDINLALVQRYEMVSSYVRMINFAIVTLTAFWANHFYYEKTKRSILGLREIREEAGLTSNDDYEQALIHIGGCNKVVVVAVIAGIGVLMMIIASKFVIPGG